MAMTASGFDVISADWPLADRYGVLTTTRHGGVSHSPFDTLNLGARCGDDIDHVRENRRRLVDRLGLPLNPCWLAQVHGCDVVRAQADEEPVADAQWSDQPDEVLALLTADCLPVVMGCDDASIVAVAHAGWRGLCGGVLENTLAQLPVAAARISAWIGPAIGPTVYEVGAEVRHSFVETDLDLRACFRPSKRHGHFLADLPALADRRLRRAGVRSVTLSQRCTFSEPDRFFSYRRDGRTGRLATVAWIL